jgi:DNA recombination protein RmuC
MFATAILSIVLLAALCALGLLARALLSAKSRLVRLEVERDFAAAELERHRQGERERNALARAEIENLSNRIFEEKTGRFKEMGTAAIAELVAPVRENLERLQKSLAESETNDALRERSLREALERVAALNSRLGDQAEGLTRALKGDNKQVGDFGEMLLEQLLEASGLRKGVHFIVQGEDLGLKDESGRHLKPDVVILLPQNRCLVVDSKMSLRSWADAQTEDETLRTVALDAFRRSVRAHVQDLSSKPYTEALTAFGKTTVEFKFLFVPVESAFQASLRLDPELYRFAFSRKIILVSPTTLLAVLATIGHTWEQFGIGQNAKAIAERANLLLDKLLDFMGAMEHVGEQLDRARGAFDEARGRLSEGKGNLVSQARKLQALGVKSDKLLPRALEQKTDEEDDLQAEA